MVCSFDERKIKTLPGFFRFHYGFIMLALIMLAVFSALVLGRSGYTSILPAVEDSLRLSNTQTGEPQALNLGGSPVTVVFAGMLADATGSFASAFVIADMIALVPGAGGSLLLRSKMPTHDEDGNP
mgnify:CR=1 FL=1